MYKKYNVAFSFLVSAFISITYHNNAYSDENHIKIYYILELEGLRTQGRVSCYRGRICDIKLDDKKTISFYFSEYYDHISSRINTRPH